MGAQIADTIDTSYLADVFRNQHGLVACGRRGHTLTW